MCGNHHDHSRGVAENTFEVEILDDGIVRIQTGKFTADQHGKADEILEFLRREGIVDDRSKVEIVRSMSTARATASKLTTSHGGWRK